MYLPDARILGRVCTHVGYGPGISGRSGRVKPNGVGMLVHAGTVEPEAALPYRGDIMGDRLPPA